MDSSIQLQKQVRDNAEDVRRFVSELNQWEEEMKRKEVMAKSTPASVIPTPPIRNASKKRDFSNSSVNFSPGDSEIPKKRISSSDYAAWEKFDVEKACEEVDSSVCETISKESEEELKIKQKRLRDEANCEKEKGNQFVKKEKWDKAIECYSRAIKCYSRDAIYYCNRALCYLKKKNYRAAETDCTSALTLDNTYVKALHRRGLARKELNQIDEACADFEHALVIEPNNTAILRDYNHIKPRAEVTVTEILEVTTGAQIEVEELEAENVEPILPAKKHRPSCATEKEIVVKKQSSNSMVWPEIDNSIIIEPVNKPPHKRSKKPLKKIVIQEDDGIALASGEPDLPVPSASNISVKLSPTKGTQSKKVEEMCSSGNSVGTTLELMSASTHLKKKNTSSTTPTLEMPANSFPKHVPPVPRNSVQFLAAWRQITKDRKMCFQYLKQINGEDLPKIFQDSMDGNTLTQLLNVLATEFVEAHEPVLSYLQGLTRVRRFRTLTLFLSGSDKNNVEILLLHTQALEKTSLETISSLKKEFEL